MLELGLDTYDVNVNVNKVWAWAWLHDTCITSSVYNLTISKLSEKKALLHGALLERRELPWNIIQRTRALAPDERQRGSPGLVSPLP